MVQIYTVVQSKTARKQYPLVRTYLSSLYNGVTPWDLEMAQDIWKLFGVVVPIGSGSFVIILINKVLFFDFP